MVFTPGAGFQITPSLDTCHWKVRPVPMLAPVTDKLKLPPEQKLEGPWVVPPFNEPGTQGVAGNHVNVNPEDGIIVFVVVQLALLTAPAVVADQSVVVVLLL
ncbi:MAG TPA: hypothetical protein VFI06_04315 [Chitinophagaceae bacterium]|nr:hypothetical protein [Chitinophagaceae bacterium]